MLGALVGKEIAVNLIGSTFENDKEKQNAKENNRLSLDEKDLFTLNQMINKTTTKRLFSLTLLSQNLNVVTNAKIRMVHL